MIWMVYRTQGMNVKVDQDGEVKAVYLVGTTVLQTVGGVQEYFGKTVTVKGRVNPIQSNGENFDANQVIQNKFRI